MVTECDAQRHDLLRIALASLAETIGISDHDQEPDLVAELTAAYDLLGKVQHRIRPGPTSG